MTYFVPDGMSASGGLCGLGDYAVQALVSTDETMVGVAGGLNPYGGFALDGATSTVPATETTVESLTFANPMLNVIADSGGGSQAGAANAIEARRSPLARTGHQT